MQIGIQNKIQRKETLKSNSTLNINLKTKSFRFFSGKSEDEETYRQNNQTLKVLCIVKFRNTSVFHIVKICICCTLHQNVVLLEIIQHMSTKQFRKDACPTPQQKIHWWR